MPGAQKVDDQIADAFGAIAELAAVMGVQAINQRPGCWELEVDGEWWFAVNGHDRPMVCSRGVELLPFCAYVEFRTWPAGLFHPQAGGTFAAGAVANEDAFIAAVKKRTALERGESSDA